LYQSVDVSDDQSVEQAIAATKARFGTIHICVNCAGISKAARTLGKEGAQPLAAFRKVIEVNLIGTFNVLRLAAEVMAQNTPEDDDNERGVIINTASAAAFEGQIGQASYSASKSGVVGMTLPIARDLATYGIRINAIAPGLIYTPMFASLPQTTIDGLVSSIQFPKRLGKPEEYAQLVRHLIENKYLNGETIRLDAGARLQPR
jgi:NAD(P)-dependent dehydrogenase (short-subunit alcohol dehydrogenase family)